METHHGKDTGLANAFLHQPPSDWGRLLENAVFIALRRQNLSIEYYRTSLGREVDFYTRTHDGAKALIQVALNIGSPATRAREVDALTEAMTETKLEQGTLITLDHEETISTPAGKIAVLPAWLWMHRAAAESE